MIDPNNGVSGFGLSRVKTIYSLLSMSKILFKFRKIFRVTFGLKQKCFSLQINSQRYFTCELKFAPNKNIVLAGPTLFHVFTF